MTGMIGKINFQGQIWMGETWVTDIISMLTLIGNLLKKER